MFPFTPHTTLRPDCVRAVPFVFGVVVALEIVGGANSSLCLNVYVLGYISSVFTMVEFLRYIEIVHARISRHVSSRTSYRCQL